MNNIFSLSKLLLFLVFCSQYTFAQVVDGFDITKAYQDAKIKGIPATDIDGYVKFLQYDYLSHKSHNHSNASSQKDVLDMGTIYLGDNNPLGKPFSPNSPQNNYCPNAGFEQLNFSSWSGEYGVVSTASVGATSPIYTQTSPTILNTAGNNVSLVNTINYHTIMSIPAINSVYPICSGYDSLACKTVGTQTISEIPVVNPNGGGVASVRLNGALANFRAERLNYNMLLNPNNKSLSVSFAIVLFDGLHIANEQSFFTVNITDQNGNLVPGCSSYTFAVNSSVTDPSSAAYDSTWHLSAIQNDVYYKKWTTYTFDFANYPGITSVNVEFTAGGCAQGGHYGYAYVDAECGLGGANTSFCSGSNSAILNAPLGYTTYQWVGSAGNVSINDGGNSPTATITPVSVGQTFTCNVTSANGCLTSFQTTISPTTVSITSLVSTATCINSSNGTVSVTATGSSSGYNYQWLNSAGSIVGNTSFVSGLPAGTYSIIVSSPLCGSDTDVVNIGILNNTSFSVTSIPSCNGGHSGSVYAYPLVGNNGYTYQWLNSSGSTVGNTQIVNGLAAGIYSVIVTSGICGIETSTINVGSFPYYVTWPIINICQGASTTTITNNNSGTNFQWYSHPYPYTLIPGATTPSLSINNSTINVYYINTYIDTTGCRDSIMYYVTPQYNSIAISDLSKICVGSTNGSAVINLNTNSPPVYNYTVTGANNFTSILANTNSTIDSVANLSAGVYTITVKDGTCIFDSTFTIEEKAISYTLSSITSTNCAVTSATLNCDLGLTAPSLSCDLSVANTCVTPNTVQIGYGTSVNTPTFLVFPEPCIFDTYVGSLNSRYQLLYTAAELNQAGVLRGKIKSLAFNIITINGTDTIPNFTIKMKCTNEPYFQGWAPLFDDIGLIPVYFNAQQNLTTGWNTYQFTNEFEWDGTSNILIDICRDFPIDPNIPPPPSFSSISPYTTTSFTSVRLFITYSGPACMVNNGLSYSANKRPNIQFGNCQVQNPSEFSYSWAPNTALTSTTNSTTIANPTSTTIYTLQITQTGQMNCTQSQTVMVNVNSTPIQTITIPTQGPYCDNFINQQLLASPIGGLWTAGTVGTTVSSSGLFSPNQSLVGNNKIYYLFNNASCISIDSITVNIIDYIPATITGSVGPYCAYDSPINLQSLTLNSGGVWTGSGITSSNTFNPNNSTIGSNSIIYKTDPLPNGLCPDTDTLTIIVNPKPNVNAVPSNTGGCNYPWEVDFMTTTVNTGTAIWDFGDGKTSSGLNTSHTYNVPGTYTATIYYTDNNGCKDTANATSPITIYAVPIAAFAPSIENTTISDAEISFLNQTSDVLINLYQWNFGDLSNSTEINPTYLYTNAGEYDVTLIATSHEGCKDTAIRKIIINPEFALYAPNAFTPDGDDLNDGFRVFIASDLTISDFNLFIYNRWGELIYTATDVNAYWNGAKNNIGAIEKQDVYAWKITYKNQNKEYKKVGHVTLLKKQS